MFRRIQRLAANAGHPGTRPRDARPGCCWQDALLGPGTSPGPPPHAASMDPQRELAQVVLRRSRGAPGRPRRAGRRGRARRGTAPCSMRRLSRSNASGSGRLVGAGSCTPAGRARAPARRRADRRSVRPPYGRAARRQLLAAGEHQRRVEASGANALTARATSPSVPVDGHVRAEPPHESHAIAPGRDGEHLRAHALRELHREVADAAARAEDHHPLPAPSRLQLVVEPAQAR